MVDKWKHNNDADQIEYGVKNGQFQSVIVSSDADRFADTVDDEYQWIYKDDGYHARYNIKDQVRTGQPLTLFVGAQGT